MHKALTGIALVLMAGLFLLTSQARAEYERRTAIVEAVQKTRDGIVTLKVSKPGDWGKLPPRLAKDLMEAQREVTGMVHSATPFDAIEDRIQVIPGLVDNERSGLWLYAWSRQGSVWQRNASAQLLQWLANRVDRARIDSR